MKNLLLILSFHLFIISAQAETNGWFIRFSIETVEGNKIEANTYMPSLYVDQDSLGKTSYLIEMLDQHHREENSFEFFKNRISYIYQVQDTNTRDTLYSLINEGVIQKDKIKEIKILVWRCRQRRITLDILFKINSLSRMHDG